MVLGVYCIVAIVLIVEAIVHTTNEDVSITPSYAKVCQAFFFGSSLRGFNRCRLAKLGHLIAVLKP